jgi:phosphopantetheinyl transferase (holo-ACP synthase)
MIGNDIVCLSTANQSKHVGSKRFLNKVFTDEEQELITNSCYANISIWKLWAAKESAYKLFVQQGLQPEFAPKKMTCKKENNHILVSTRNYKTRVHCIANSKWVYAQTISENFKFVNGCFRLDSNTYFIQSKTVELALKQKTSKIFQIDICDINITKAINNIPKLTYKNTFLPVNISLTHHGYFGAYALAFD